MTGYDQWHESLGDDDDISAPWHTFVKTRLLAADIEDKTVLEIGCGRGGFSHFLTSLNPPARKITASDYSQAALDIARARYSKSTALIDWKQQDIMALDFPANSFDTVISCETIEHVPDPEKAIKELFRVMKPGGRFFLTCPNYFNPFGIWCFYRWMIGKPFTEGGQPYVNYILAPRVRAWIKKAGFEIQYFRSAEIIIPARVPKHFWDDDAPFLLRIFGHRTFYILRKK